MDAPIYHLEKVVRVRTDDVEDFTGPLDLILNLLAKNKMEIQDIQISLILDQYMEWIEKRRAMDLEVASEFITMASQLMFIKTRMLLSIHDEEAISELDQLIASLEEHRRHEGYAKIQAIIPQLSDRYEIGRNYITKVPEHMPINKVYHYRHKSEDLFQAMTTVMERVDNHLPPPMTAFEGIVGRLHRFGVTRFHALFRGNRSRSEIVATFLAVLELCKARRLRLAGTETDCTVTSIGGGDEDFEFSADTY